ncbi:MAG: dephospho-CoA kinase [Conchiformibius sp.]|nr:dephospho-CoA kinase [Conchiformibius sp.]
MTTWVALTGGIGSGKSQAALYFRQLGVPVIDADAVNRELISTPDHPALQQIATLFGKEMLDENGCLNRPRMRQLIFSQAEAKQQLESVLHPFILDGIRQQQAQHRDAVYGMVELPTLTEHPHFRPLVARVLLIHSSEKLRIERVMQRNGLSKKEVCAIMAAQASDSERLTAADDIIHNTGSLKALSEAVFRQHLIYQRIFNALL